MRIDGHQHFWRYNQVRHKWIDDSMQILKADYLPEDLKAELIDNSFDGTVVVQAEQSVDETDFLIKLAGNYEFIKGVVGWVDLKSDMLPEQLDYYKTIPVVKGFRHVLQDEESDFMLDPGFIRGIKILKVYGYTYDILIYSNQLNSVVKLADELVDVNLVVDHIGKPKIKTGELYKWEKAMRQLAEYPNIMCKLSGLVTEADHRNWNEEIFRPYLDVLFDAFGVERLIFGSDWPVCLLSGTYSQVYEIIRRYTSRLSIEDQNKIFGQNAARFYSIK